MAENNDVVMIELDRPRQLRFSHRAMKRWSAHSGKPISKLDTDALTPEEVEAMMYFMLEADAAANGESLTLDQMEDLLDQTNLGTLYRKIGEAMEAAFDGGGGEKNKKRAANGTGTNS